MNNSRPTSQNTRTNALIWAGFILAHIPLALVMNSFQFFSTLHALITAVVGLMIALTTREPRKIAWIAAYICGAEVLWRMTKAGVFWEFGKYAIVALLGIYLLRMRKIKYGGLPILFVLLLTISIPLTLGALNLDNARQEISYALSGTLCLAVCVFFFYQVRFTWEDRVTLLWYGITPILGIAILCLQGIVTATELTFGSESTSATSGGFGPNQVSAVLGLGTLFLFLLAIQKRKAYKRWLPLILGLGLLAFCVLTFSRGGLYNVAASLLAAAVISLRSPRLRATFFSISLSAILLGGYFIFPQLNNFTGGMLATRFSDTSATGRIEIMRAELEVWKQHPILGVGPGMATNYAFSFLGSIEGTHTEYTRILAEHGIPGILAILLLLIIGIKALSRASKGLPQVWTAALLVWPLVDMTHAATRIAAVGFIFGLAVAQWESNPESPPKKISNQDHFPHR